MFLTSAFTTAPKAAPMMTATARSIMLPLSAKVLNSCHSFSMSCLHYAIVPRRSTREESKKPTLSTTWASVNLNAHVREHHPEPISDRNTAPAGDERGQRDAGTRRH